MEERLIVCADFSAKYDLDTHDIHHAIREAGLEPVRKAEGRLGKPAMLFDEREVAKAVAADCLRKRKYYLDKAKCWTERAQEIAKIYKGE